MKGKSRVNGESIDKGVEINAPRCFNSLIYQGFLPLSPSKKS
jgi:uncharacterized protein (DUF983 family)